MYLGYPKMSKNIRLSKFKAIISAHDGQVLSMCNVAVEKRRKKNVGHGRTMYMLEFDYDKFAKQGHTVDDHGQHVFKVQIGLLRKVKSVLGESGYKKFISSAIKSADLESGLDVDVTRSVIIQLYEQAIHGTESYLDSLQDSLKDVGLARMTNFVLKG